MLALKLYQGFWSIAPFLIKKRLAKRGKVSSAYKEHWEERFGRPYHEPVVNGIWLHAVSVGEARAAQVIIEKLKQKYPERPFLITVMTPTAREQVRQLYPFAQCRYLPYDKKTYVQQFLREHKPFMALWMETEIWPNFLFHLKWEGIPTFLLSARLSRASYESYKRVRYLSRLAIQSFDIVFAQSTQDEVYFKALGAKNVQVVGNSKYDIPISPQAFKKAECFRSYLEDPSRPIIVCGSTRAKNAVDEAYLLLSEWKQHKNQALLVIVPRHPANFTPVYEKALQLGFNTVRRSQAKLITSEVEVVIGDSMGELLAYYLCASVAFVGGSLVNTGGQNILEPIRCKIPTIFGFSTYHFAEVCRSALQAGCAIQVHTVSQWYEVIDRLLTDKTRYNKMVLRTSEWIKAQEGASEAMVSKISSSLA
ncbi:MAG: 3-deoxy-D-manno-octulosonic acid transferase [Neisseriaceae bacterium]